MKTSDNYSGKLELWAKTGKVCRIPRIANLPYTVTSTRCDATTTGA